MKEIILDIADARGIYDLLYGACEEWQYSIFELGEEEINIKLRCSFVDRLPEEEKMLVDIYRSNWNRGYNTGKEEGKLQGATDQSFKSQSELADVVVAKIEKILMMHGVIR